MPNPIADMYVMSLTNSNEGGILNVAQIGLECAPAGGSDRDTTVAQWVAYIVAARGYFLASGTLITGVKYREHGTGGFVEVPFPSAEYGALVALNPALVALSDYDSVVLGASGGLAPVGTSVCVTEYTSTFGRTGRGRHFLPFVNKAKVDGAGLLDTNSIVNIEDAYTNYIRTANPSFGTVGLAPVVQNAARTTIKAITTVKAQPVLSNLRSRRR